MTPERWKQVKELFHGALEQQPSARCAYLDQACAGNAELRADVESLISSYEQTGEFIDAPAYEAAASLIMDNPASLSPSSTLGSYRVISTLGRGGMGEVYLAEDLRLHRKVALKLLPASFATDPERLARFEREARAASALNHPNILTIYEVGSFDGRQFIASEYVDGETLRQRQRHSRLKVLETLDVVIQIASALSAAHQAGIVHRDIKPENIMIRHDGYVKVVDFGLAKLTEQAKTSVDTSTPTVLQVDTGTGVVMGTTAYMSPEQARGQQLDARTDIWSLGVVLYETVSGSMPFKGETSSDLIVSILDRDPAPLATTPVPPSELDWIIRKALRKDREERYQTARELLGDLRGLKQQLEFAAQKQRAENLEGVAPSDSLPAAPVSASSGPISTDPARTLSTTEVERSPIQTAFPRRRLITGAAVVVLILAGAAAAYWLWPRTSGSSVFTRTRLTRLTNSGSVIDATLSPDGRYLVYSLSDARKQSVWIRQVSTANDKVIVPPAEVGMFGITVSRDGNDLYYVIKQNLDKGTLYRVPLLGGTPTKLLEWIDSAVTFSPDGKQMAFLRGNFPNEGESALIVVNADGSAERVLAQRKRPDMFVPIFFSAPSWSPDGGSIACAVGRVGGPSQLIAFHVADGKEEILTKSDYRFIARSEWLPDMSALLMIAGPNPSEAQVWLLEYPSGKTRAITNDFDQHRSIGLPTAADKFVTVIASRLISVWVVPDGDASKARQMPVGNLSYYGNVGNSVAWTPDDRIIYASDESGRIDLWAMDADGSNRKQLTANGGRNVNPVVTPDGRYIVFTSTRAGRAAIWRIDVDGRNPKQLTNGQADSLPSISPDSKWVVYSSLGTTKPTVWKVSIDGGDATELTTKVSISPIVSPDGKWIAYLYPDSHDPFAPTNRIAIMPFAGGEPVKILPYQTADRLPTITQWSADGKSILFTSNRNNVTNIWSQPVDGGEAKQLTDFKEHLMTSFSLSRDGKNLVCTRGSQFRDAVLISDVK